VKKREGKRQRRREAPDRLMPKLRSAILSLIWFIEYTTKCQHKCCGASVAHYEYDPYGNLVIAEGSAAQDNPFRFSTKYLDGETGWYYYGYGYYSPELGRWTRRDPIEEQGFLWTLRKMVRARADEASCGILTGPTMSEETEGW